MSETRESPGNGAGVLSKLSPLLTRQNLEAALWGVSQWLDEARASTGEPGRCHRSSVFHQDGSITWTHPNSNTSELITAWLDLADVFDSERSRFEQYATEYARRFVSDGVHGLYRGEAKEAWGLAWYWTDDGTYTGGYSMRAAGALERLYRRSPDERLMEACREIGETFLARQLPSGFVSMVGWCPNRGWLSERIAGSRYGYAVATFATLYRLTGDSRYRVGYDRALKALEAMQTEDGSFYQHYDPVTLRATDASIKPHFFSYLFNALAEAHGIFQDERLVFIGEKMAAFLLRIYEARHHIPYCIDPTYESDRAGANSAVMDSAAGLLWLHGVTGEPRYLALAQKLWVSAWLHQPGPNAGPGRAGAIMIGNRRCDLWFANAFVAATIQLLRLT